MNRYRPTAPRPSLGLAALALAAATLALAVVAPATSLDAADPASARASGPAAQTVRIDPSRIEVTGVRASAYAGERSSRRPAS